MSSVCNSSLHERFRAFECLGFSHRQSLTRMCVLRVVQRCKMATYRPARDPSRSSCFRGSCVSSLRRKRGVSSSRGFDRENRESQVSGQVSRVKSSGFFESALSRLLLVPRGRIKFGICRACFVEFAVVIRRENKVWDLSSLPL